MSVHLICTVAAEGFVRVGKVTTLPSSGISAESICVGSVRGELTIQYWYLRDLIEKRRSDNLAVEDRETAAAMAVQTMDYFQRKWPGAKVWFMHPPQADEDDYKAKTVGEFCSCSCRVAVCRHGAVKGRWSK